MKYLAILKDSLREAIDTKVFYFTAGLSALLVLLIGSLTFRPVPVDEQLRLVTRFMTWALGQFPEAQGMRYDIVDFQQTNDAATPWRGEYRFFFVLELPNEQIADDLRKKRAISVERMQEQMRQLLPWAEQVDVKEGTPASPREVRFDVQTHGSKVNDRRDWTHEPALLFGALPMSIFQMPLKDQLDFIADKVIGSFGAAVTLLISIIITAFFIPNMLRKGTVDLLLAKPVHRSTLLIYKFLGGLSFMFLNTAIIMTGIWLALGLQTGVWIHGLLVCILVFTCQFALFYVISTLMAVMTGSPIVAILVAVAAWPLFWTVGMVYRGIDKIRPEKLSANPRESMQALPGWVYATVDTLHFITPPYKDFDLLTTRLIRGYLVDPTSKEGKELDETLGSVRWTHSIAITVVFIGLLLGVSCWWFATKDY